MYAHHEDTPGHVAYRAWLEQAFDGDDIVGVSGLVLSGFLRVVTHPRIFERPAPLDIALDFARAVRAQPNAVVVAPGARHWEIFTRLCRGAAAKGNLVTDAYLAALALELGSEIVTADRDFARFPGLRWRHPLSA